VLFSLGLFFNATGAAIRSETTTSSTPEHRPRRESIQLSSMMGTLSTSQQLDFGELINENYSETENDDPRITSSAQKRRAESSDAEDSEHDGLLTSPSNKRIKKEPPSTPPPLIPTPLPSNMEISNEDEDEFIDGNIVSPQIIYEHQTSSNNDPLAIAAVVPTHSFSSYDIEFSSTMYRSVNIHVWPMLR